MKLDWNYPRLGDRDVQSKFARNISEDSVFSQLETFYHEEAVLSYLNPPLQRAGRAAAKSCQILKVGYVCKKKLVVVYCFRDDRSDEDSLILVVRFFPKDEDAAGYRTIKSTARDKNAVLHIPGWSAVAVIFPEDPGLSTLHNMFDFQNTAQSLRPMIGETVDRKALSWDLMSYQPGQRCTIRYRIPDRRLICKLAAREVSARTHNWMLQLWDAPDRCFNMPQPLGLDRSDGRRWESYLEGVSVGPDLAKLDLASLSETVASGMRSFHRIPLTGLRPLGATQILQKMEKKLVRKLSRSLSPLRPEIDIWFKVLTEKAASLPPEPAVTLHGDAHPANILFDGERLAFIDLDALAAGSPAYDLARFGSRLLLMALMKNARITDIGKMMDSLPEAYEKAGGRPIPATVFAWYVSAILVGKELMACIKNRASDLGRLSPVMLNIAQAALCEGEISRVVQTNKKRDF